MKVPFLCRVGLHRLKKPRRINGFRVRRCAKCPMIQEENFPGGTWRVVMPKKRVRKPKALHIVTAIEEQNLDRVQGLGPL